MKIINIDGYLDGGTLRITTETGIYYIDNRIRTLTTGKIYDGYPSTSTNILENQSEIREAIIEALDGYNPDLIFDWKPRVLSLLNATDNPFDELKFN